MPESGIRINGKLYAIPKSARLGELREIKRITGLNPPEFSEALDTIGSTADPDVLAGLVWWVMHREDPAFTLADLDEIEMSAIEGESGDESGVVEDPKESGALSASSPISADASSSSPDAPGQTTHANGGGPDLVPSGLAT